MPPTLFVPPLATDDGLVCKFVTLNSIYFHVGPFASSKLNPVARGWVGQVGHTAECTRATAIRPLAYDQHRTAQDRTARLSAPVQTETLPLVSLIWQISAASVIMRRSYCAA